MNSHTLRSVMEKQFPNFQLTTEWQASTCQLELASEPAYAIQYISTVSSENYPSLKGTWKLVQDTTVGLLFLCNTTINIIYFNGWHYLKFILGMYCLLLCLTKTSQMSDCHWSGHHCIESKRITGCKSHWQ